MNTLMLLLVLAALSGIVAIATNVIRNHTYRFDFDNVIPIMIGVMIAALIFACAVCIETYVEYPKRIDIFKKQKSIVETMSPWELSSTGMNVKILDMNNNLFDMQHCRERYGDWSLYPESVLDIEPIR